jgi:LysR family transcriptional regulator, regulator for genes of the gallate degradation pathway
VIGPSAIGGNLRHLRVFLAVAQGGSVTRAADLCRVSQPAVTQALAKLEGVAGQDLFRRTPQGLFATEAGAALASRVDRALQILDQGFADMAPRLSLTATRAQLAALVGVVETQNFSLAARRLGIAQPTAHRAVTQLEEEAGRDLFSRTAHGVLPSRGCVALARAVRLAFAELDQAAAELAERAGQDGGQIVVGAMPLSRSFVLPQALARFRKARPLVPVRILEGTYDELLTGLRRGEIDLLIGALRYPAPIEDVVQERLFDDSLVLLAGVGHPLLTRPVTPEALVEHPWLMPRAGTPSRLQFDKMFAARGLTVQGVTETGSVILMREMLGDGHHLACISQAQASGELTRGLVHALDFVVPGPPRPIGLTLRQGWRPTPAQEALLTALRAETETL